MAFSRYMHFVSIHDDARIDRLSARYGIDFSGFDAVLSAAGGLEVMVRTEKMRHDHEAADAAFSGECDCGCGGDCDRNEDMDRPMPEYLWPIRSGRFHVSEPDETYTVMDANHLLRHRYAPEAVIAAGQPDGGDSAGSAVLLQAVQIAARVMKGLRQAGQPGVTVRSDHAGVWHAPRVSGTDLPVQEPIAGMACSVAMAFNHLAGSIVSGVKADTLTIGADGMMFRNGQTSDGEEKTDLVIGIDPEDCRWHQPAPSPAISGFDPGI